MLATNPPCRCLGIHGDGDQNDASFNDSAHRVLRRTHNDSEVRVSEPIQGPKSYAPTALAPWLKWAEKLHASTAKVHWTDDISQLRGTPKPIVRPRPRNAGPASVVPNSWASSQYSQLSRLTWTTHYATWCELGYLYYLRAMCWRFSIGHPGNSDFDYFHEKLECTLPSSCSFLSRLQTDCHCYTRCLGSKLTLQKPR